MTDHPAKENADVMGFRLTVACPSGNLLSIVTLNWNGSVLKLAPRASTFVKIASQDQTGVRIACATLFKFLESHDITQIVVRRLSMGGPTAASTNSIRFETMLQLMPIDCEVVTTQKMAQWVKQEDWHFPLPQKRLRPELQKLQLRAIQTGGFVVGRFLAQMGVNGPDVNNR